MTKAEQVAEELAVRLEGKQTYDNNLEFLWSDYGQIQEVQEIKDIRRWLTHMTTYWLFDDDSVLGIDWGKANTEIQESEGPYQIYLAEYYEVTVRKYRAKLD